MHGPGSSYDRRTPRPRVFCQAVVVHCGVSFQSEKAGEISPFRHRSCLVLVWLLHEGVGLAVGVALESDHPAVVDGAVDDRGGHVGVAEDPAPSAELDVGGVDDALPFVRVGDDLEQQAAALLVDRDVSELVDDQEACPADLGEFPVEPVLRAGAQ